MILALAASPGGIATIQFPGVKGQVFSVSKYVFRQLFVSVATSYNAG
jgi:hypothetical protein